MSYVSRSLSENEKIIRMGSVHWIVFAWPVIWMVIGTVTMTLVIGIFIFIIALLALIGAIFYKFTTELAVTDKKVVAKWGFISRKTIEQRLSKIDAVTVNQSTLGRLLNYGEITIQGSGMALTPIKNVSDPLAFRRAVEVAEGAD